jgi:4a-hydroxytetrahydrobiopterin dehydratase
MAKAVRSSKKSGSGSEAAAGENGRMDSTAIERALANMPEWAEVGGSIQRTFGFPNFVAAMEFVNKVAAAAEADQHHPDILIRYNKVTMSLNTHDAGGITAKDFALAAKMDAMVAG